MTPPPPRGKLDGVDALRGLAVLLVILFHLRNGGGSIGYHPAVSAALAPFAFGFSGVHLFLVLSGFCLTHSLIRRDRAGRPPSLRSYLKARWWRIGPPYYVAMLLYLSIPVTYALIGHPSPLRDDLTIRQVVAHLTFLHGLWPDTIWAINVPFWSLSLEFQFYLALPALYALARLFGVGAMIGVVASSSLFWRGFVQSAWPEWAYLNDGLFLGRWAEFALGMGVAWWYNRPDRRPAGWPAWLAASAFLASAIGLLAWRGDKSADYLFGLGYATLLAAVLEAGQGAGRLAAIVGARPLVKVGMISYSLYLTHNLILERTIQVYRRLVTGPSLATDVALCVAVVGLVLLGGGAFYRVVESRFVRSIDAPRPAQNSV